jgi:hypothetical protein
MLNHLQRSFIHQWNRRVNEQHGDHVLSYESCLSQDSTVQDTAGIPVQEDSKFSAEVMSGRGGGF